MDTGKVIFFGLALITTFMVPTAHASECIRDLGTSKYFGSYEQLIEIQKMAKKPCSVAGIAGDVTKPAPRSTLIIADFEAGKIFRLRLNSSEWETWSGFTRKQVLADDPEDGFDLPGYKKSSGNQSPKVTQRMADFIKANGLSQYVH
jgi:hypothetical protein